MIHWGTKKLLKDILSTCKLPVPFQENTSCMELLSKLDFVYTEGEYLRHINGSLGLSFVQKRLLQSIHCSSGLPEFAIISESTQTQKKNQNFVKDCRIGNNTHNEQRLRLKTFKKIVLSSLKKCDLTSLVLALFNRAL